MKQKTTKTTITKITTPLRDQCLSHCATLGIPLTPAALDELLSRAEKEGLPHLQFLDLLLGAEAHARRERGVAREPEVIVAAEVDELTAAFDRDPAVVRPGAGLDCRARAPELRAGELRQRRLKRRRGALHGPRP